MHTSNGTSIFCKGSIYLRNRVKASKIMKIFRLTFAVFLFFLFLLLGLKLYRNFNISRNLKNEEKNKLKKSAEVLNNCFDLKNKSQRSLNDSMKLFEYCLDRYGSKNKFN